MMIQEQIVDQLRQLEMLIDQPFSKTASRLMDTLVFALEGQRITWNMETFTGGNRNERNPTSTYNPLSR